LKNKIIEKESNKEKVSSGKESVDFVHIHMIGGYYYYGYVYYVLLIVDATLAFCFFCEGVEL
jgi:hypothetical protein